MDYAEEQNNEIEALESIYSEEFEIIATEPLHVFTVMIKSENYEKDTAGVMCLVKFEYTPTYPDEVPIICMEESDNLSEEYEKELMNLLLDQAAENVGMVMIFTLVSAAQEWINNRSDLMAKEKEEEEVIKKKQEEEAEMKKFEGTRVTVESFINWKQQFEAELGLSAKREKEEKGRKLTGRELFMQDKSLNESDLKFLTDGEVVQVDESLFQDLEDLDIESEGGSDEEES